MRPLSGPLPVEGHALSVIPAKAGIRAKSRQVIDFNRNLPLRDWWMR
ncbi:hypothetical protein [Azospirillum palustre]